MGTSRGNLGADLHRDHDLAVPQDLLGHARMNVEGSQQRPAGLPGAVDGDPRHLGLGEAAVEAAAEVPRLEGCAMSGGEHQAGINPGTIGTVAVTLLLLGAELERGHAQLGQRQRRFGCLGLDLAAEQLAADPLDLLADVQLGRIEVGQIPGQSEDFALAQAQGQAQDERGVQRFTVAAGRFEKPAGFVNRPRPAFTRAWSRKPRVRTCQPDRRQLMATSADPGSCRVGGTVCT
jgi:hypothetical protein